MDKPFGYALFDCAQGRQPPSLTELWRAKGFRVQGVRVQEKSVKSANARFKF